jgi:CheY-like chemotaxis protein
MVSWMHMKTVLLVEDNEDMRALLTKQLKSLGVRVLSAYDAQSTLSLYFRYHTTIDCIVMDVRLPEDLSGIELYGRTQQDSKDTKPVVFISADCHVNLPQSVKAKESWSFLKKPFSSADLELALHFVGTAPRSPR